MNRHHKECRQLANRNAIILISTTIMTIALTVLMILSDVQSCRIVV